MSLYTYYIGRGLIPCLVMILVIYSLQKGRKYLAPAINAVLKFHINIHTLDIPVYLGTLILNFTLLCNCLIEVRSKYAVKEEAGPAWMTRFSGEVRQRFEEDIMKLYRDALMNFACMFLIF